MIIKRKILLEGFSFITPYGFSRKKTKEKQIEQKKIETNNYNEIYKLQIIVDRFDQGRKKFEISRYIMFLISCC